MRRECMWEADHPQESSKSLLLSVRQSELFLQRALPLLLFLTALSASLVLIALPH
jgi:hypothetical protein